MSDSRWHRRVSPLFFLPILFAGLAVGLACFLGLSAVLPAFGA